MKKIFFLMLLAFTFAGPGTIQKSEAQTSYLNGVPRSGEDFLDQYQVSTQTFANVLYQSPNSYRTFVKVGSLTHALTDSVKINNARFGDILILEFTCDTLTAGRVVTFGNNFVSAGTLTVDKSQKAIAMFIFDAVAFVEVSRAKQ